MAGQIVLLRGINVGAHNRIAMPALRETLGQAGFQDVRTYLQSGNLVLGSDAPPEAVAAECERRIEQRFGLAIEVVVRSREQLAAVVEHNPLGDVASDPKRYQVSFLAEELDPAMAQAVLAAAVAPERVAISGREVFAWHPEGVARSRLWTLLASRRLGVRSTARNWTTVTNLLALAER